MSEYDRGAYTPPTEESFAFDARSPKISKPVPATLVGSLVVLVVLVGAVTLFYWSGLRSGGEAPRVVGKPQVEIKTPAPVDAKPLPEDEKLDVYDHDKGQTATAPPKTAFGPAPEEPQPRSQPGVQAQAAPPPTQAQPQAQPQTQAQIQAQTQTQVQAQAVTPPPARAAPTRQAAAEPAKTAAPPPVKTAAGKAVPKKAADPVGELLARNEAVAPAAPLAAKPAKAPAKAAATPSTAAAPAPHGLMVQIGAFSSQAIADSQLAKAHATYAAETAGKTKHVEKAEVNGKTYYRAAFAGFDRPGAQAFCKALSTDNIHCIIK